MTLPVEKDQHGFSLIEMMVAMLIGLFLMGGVISVYTSSSQSSRINSAIRTMQENGRFAITMLKSSIQNSGFVNNINITAFNPEEKINPFPSASAVQLSQQYESDIDCEGDDTTGLALPFTGMALNTFSVNASDELICAGNGTAGNQVIIEGVDEMRILYGLDENSDGIADRFVSADDVTATGGITAWTEQVCSVRIALLLNSILDIKPTNESKTYNLLDFTTASINDRKLHKIFTTTILIRNRMS